MSTYAIGDLQGCFASLQALLTRIDFQKNRDQLWFVGDLVNRGPGSLACLRFVANLGKRATVVLGNHDLHLLAVADGISKSRKRDTIQPILDAPDCEDLLAWLRGQQILHIDQRYAMVHAGILPNWDIDQALMLAAEIESQIRGPNRRAFLKTMYGDQPDQWDATLTGSARHRIVTNAFTRMRILSDDDRLDLEFKGELAAIPPGCAPWFSTRHPSWDGKTVLAGHWSALGLHVTPNFIGLDTGCAWGRQLTALRLEDRAIFQVECAETVALDGRE